MENIMFEAIVITLVVVRGLISIYKSQKAAEKITSELSDGTRKAIRMFISGTVSALVVFITINYPIYGVLLLSSDAIWLLWKLRSK